jgi:hypothetical protein
MIRSDGCSRLTECGFAVSAAFISCRLHNIVVWGSPAVGTDFISGTLLSPLIRLLKWLDYRAQLGGKTI